MRIRSRYLLTRILQAVLVVAITYLLTYWVLFALPGDPVANRLDNPQNPVPPSQAQAIIEYYHLDDPALVQFLLTVGRLFQGDLGYSLGTGRAVSDLILQGLGSTLLLALAALGVAALLAVSVAALAVFAPWEPVRSLARLVPALSLATPSFLIGLLLLQIFSYQLGWVSSLDTESPASLILPALTLGIGASPAITQVLIQGLTEAHQRPFVKVLRSRGLSPGTIASRHVFRNGSLPALTLLALTIADLIAGSVIVESVFHRAGLGYVTEQAVRSQDSPIVLAVVLLVSSLYSLINLVTDLLYPVIDPRISLAESRLGSGSSASRTLQPAAPEVA